MLDPLTVAGLLPNRALDWVVSGPKGKVIDQHQEEPSMVAGFVAGSAAGFVVSTLGEYAMHRWMHQGIALRKVHGRHHLLQIGQGWLGEFIDYGRGGMLPGLILAAPLVWPLRFPNVALGFLFGVGLHNAFAAYSHQVQHEKPHLVFWMKKPVHFLHHDQGMWTKNFGISTDIWDRIFGTYQDVAWNPIKRGLRNPLREFVAINWGSPPKFSREARSAWEREILAQRRRVSPGPALDDAE